MKPPIEDLLWISIELPCLACGEVGVIVRLEDTNQFHCNNCSKDFDADAVREHVDSWQAILAWCKSIRRDPSRFRTGPQRN